jgi:3-hydroxyisobutyrate dehydrogenase-like beta-hydroxyacid dehydrogenase
MGGPMSRHLVSRGYTVQGYDIRKEACTAAALNGVCHSASIREACSGADLVLLNLPTTDAVRDVVTGSNGLLECLVPHQVVVDFSTIELDAAHTFIQRVTSIGCAWVDAPVSGGPAAAGQGSLTVMAGGHAEALERVQTLMSHVAARFTVVGPPGSGLVAKMLNQLIVGCLHAVIAEAVLVAEHAGIDATLIPQALAGGHADGVLFQQIVPRMLERDFAPRGYARQLLKDLDMVLAYAGRLKLPTPMTSQAQTLYRLLVHLGHAELDTSAVLKVFEPRN